MPDGSVAYVHVVSTTGTLEEVIGAPPPDSAQVERPLRAMLKRGEGKVNLIVSQREADGYRFLREIIAMDQCLVCELGNLSPVPFEQRCWVTKPSLKSGQAQRPRFC